VVASYSNLNELVAFAVYSLNAKVKEPLKLNEVIKSKTCLKNPLSSYSCSASSFCKKRS